MDNIPYVIPLVMTVEEGSSGDVNLSLASKNSSSELLSPNPGGG